MADLRDKLLVSHYVESRVADNKRSQRESLAPGSARAVTHPPHPDRHGSTGILHIGRNTKGYIVSLREVRGAFGL